MTTDQQSQILNAEVARDAKRGWTVSSVSGGQAVMQRKKKLNALLHIILSVITGGLWLIVVAVLVINRKIETQVLSVDAYGKVRRK